MNIGTAKPEASEINRICHHLIDFLDPGTSYSAFDYSRDAYAIIRELAAQGKTGFVCGGTGLYFESLRRGMAPQVASDPGFRDRLKQRARQEGSTALHKELMEKDPVSAAKIHPHDEQRLIRALSVFHATGTPMSELRRLSNPPSDLSVTAAVVIPPREMLYERINRRVEKMALQGLYEEFITLIRGGYTEKSPGLHCIGYRELFAVQRGECTLSEAVEAIKQNTRNYAKRQCAWFTAHNRDEIVDWSDDQETLHDRVMKKLSMSHGTRR
jgi:tRNA dimethylallyltransferase